MANVRLSNVVSNSDFIMSNFVMSVLNLGSVIVFDQNDRDFADVIVWLVTERIKNKGVSYNRENVKAEAFEVADGYINYPPIRKAIDNLYLAVKKASC